VSSSIHIAFILSLCALLSCSAPETESNVLAEAYGNKLYADELNELIGESVTQEDSVFITQEYINQWLSKQVLLHKAEEVLSEVEKNKEKQLENYKADLLTFEVLNKLATQSVDTSFEESELEEYYEENEEDFELAQNILKINFFKIPEQTNGVSKLWDKFKKDDKAVYAQLKSISEKRGNYYVDKTNWVYFDDILKEIPITTYNQENYLNNNKFIRFNDNGYTYFIKIIDFKIRSDKSPFSLERQNIKDVLIMKRQQEMVKEIETKLIDEAYNNKEIKRF
jgi:hypothetical protein